MAQVGLNTLTKEWLAFSEITTPDEGTTYYIQNRGSDFLLAAESSSTPSDAFGILVRPFEVIKYEKGSQNLYLRAYTTNCTVNVTSEG